jgi:hypothetical protein
VGCLSEDKLARLLTGALGGWEHRQALRHLDRCAGCRTRYEELAPVLREGFVRLAEDEGLLPPDPAAARQRVLDGVSRRLEERPPFLPRVLRLTAAAAILLAMVLLGRHLLEGDRRVGSLAPTGGVVLVGSHEDGFRRLGGESVALSPGEIVLVAPGGHAEARLASGAEADLEGCSILVVNDPRSGTDLSLARGNLVLRSSNAEPIRIGLRGLPATVMGTAEVMALPSSPRESIETALAWSRAESERRGPRLLRLAFGKAPVPEAAVVAIHALEGSVEVGEGYPAVSAGEELVVGPGGAPDLGWVGDRPAYLALPDGELDRQDLARVDRLFDRDPEDPFEALAAAARDSDLDIRTRGLAVWLLGELGAADAIPELRGLFARRPERTPPGVRAAAVRALARLDAWEEVRSALADPEPAVAETAVLSLPEHGRKADRESLARLSRDGFRPEYLRALAAGRGFELGLELPVKELGDLSRSKDPDAARIADRLLLLHSDQPGGWSVLVSVLESPSSPHGPARRAEILEWLAEIKASGAAAPARRALAEVNEDPQLRAAAISYLAELEPDSLLGSEGDLLRGGPGPVRHAAMKALRGLRDQIPGTWRRIVEANRTRLEELLHAPGTPGEELVLLLALVPPDDDFLAGLIRGHRDEDVRRQALDLASLRGSRFSDPAALEESTRDASPRVREFAWQALAGCRPVEALRRLQARIRAASPGDPEEYVAGMRNLAASLQEGADPEGLADLLAEVSADHRWPALQAESVAILGTLARRGSSGAAAALLEVFGSEAAHPRVRAAAAERMVRAATSGAVLEALRLALGSPDRALANRVAAALNGLRRSKEIPPGLAEALRGAASTDYGRAVLALCSPADLAEAGALLEAGNLPARALLLRDLAEEHLPEVAVGLRTAARSDDPGIAAWAAMRLAQLDPGTEPSEELRAVVARHEPRMRLLASQTSLGHIARGAALREALALVRERAASRAVLDLGSRVAPEKRRAALRVLAWAGRRADVRAMLACLNDADPVAPEAERSLRRILARSREGLETTGEHTDLERWWSEREFAFGVPVLGNVYRRPR